MGSSGANAEEVPSPEFASRIRATGRRWRGFAAEFLTVPRFRRLRWIILLGLAVRLLLAPVSSWDFDTPSFVQTGISTLYSGSPYTAGFWSNPPLAAFVAAPFLAVPALLYGPQGLVVAVSAIAPVTVATGVNATYLPTPAALLAWKLPFILADLVVAALLYEFPKWFPLGLPFSREAIVAAWFLNPLVIWSSSVHGEIDGLAILLVLLALAALASRHWTSCGLFLSLAIFTKGYPLVLVPMVVAAIAAWPGTDRSLGRRALDIGRYALGFAVGVLPFLGFLPQTVSILTGKATNPSYGGISVLAIFNAASPRGGGWYAAFSTNLANAAAILSVFRGLALLGIVGGGALLVYQLLRTKEASQGDRLRWVLLAAQLAIAGVILSDSVPQPENLIALIPLGLLALSRERARWSAAFLGMLSAGGVLLYWSILTPLGMLYPLAHLIGPSSVLWVNSVVLGYVHTPLVQGSLWLVAGLMGGAAVLLTWLMSGNQLVPWDDLRSRLGRGRGHEPVAQPPAV